MVSLVRQLQDKAGLTPVEISLSDHVAAKVAGLDTDLTACSRQVEIGNALTGLMAIGMTRWDAMVSVVNGGSAMQSDFSELDGIPKKMICTYPDIKSAICEFDRLARSNSQMANRCLNLNLAGARIDGNLELENKRWLTSLPDGLHVGGGAYLYGSKGLVELGSGLSVGGDLYAGGCDALVSLPAGLRVGGNMNLISCYGLTSLSDGLQVGGSLSLTNCKKLSLLPDGLRVGKSLRLEYCVSLAVLPCDLHVGESLYLSGCKSLKSIVDGLHVGERLHMGGCSAWDGMLPDNTVVDSFIFSDEYMQGISMRDYRRLRDVDNI